MIGLNKIGLNQVQLNLVQLNQLYLNTLCACQKSSGGDGFPRLPGDVTRWSFKGLTNEMMSKNPRLEDADHKGRFLTFKNFAWGGMSGCGGYSLSKETFSYTPDIYSFNFTDPEGGLKIFDVYFQLIGLEENSGVTFNLDIIESGTAKRIKRETYTKDGIYHFEYKSEDDAVRLYMIGYNGVGEDRTTFTVKILPYYAGALVFDGVDDYGICDNFPILTKEKGYTVVALRQWISNKISSTFIHKGTLSSEGAFIFEFIRSTGEENVSSFGKATITDISKKAFSYQTSNSYNGVSITPGNKEDGNVLRIGKGVYENYTNVALWELIILDHDATEEELTKIKNYFIKTYPWLFFDQAWTVVGKSNEDTDRATIANITGNGNDLVLSNFGFAGNSGYGEYAQNFNHYGFSNLKTITYTRTAASMQLDVPAGSSGNIYSNVNGEDPIGFVYNFNLKITGLKTGNSLSISRGATLDNIIANINQDGVYNIKATVDDSWNQRRIYFWIRNSNGPETTLSIEQIPDHDGYLVTDGVDDMIGSSIFEIGKDFTIIGEWKFMDNIIANAGISKALSLFVYNTNNGLRIFINNTTKGPVLNTKTLKAICSDGRVYSDDWSEMIVNEEQPITSSKSSLLIGINENNFAKIALKNLAIYNQILSKDDCIKAYIYLQTLKAKMT